MQQIVNPREEGIGVATSGGRGSKEGPCLHDGKGEHATNELLDDCSENQDLQ